MSADAMNLLEHRAKSLFKSYGIKTPEGYVIRSPGELRDVTGPVVLKAQVPVGGRGKAGGIRPATTIAEARAAAEAILQLDIGGHVPKEILVEERLHISKEIYLSIALDRSARLPVLIASASGGVDVESIPDEEISRWHIHPFLGVQGYQAREVAASLGAGGEPFKGIVTILHRLWRLFWDYDCELAEINPLILTNEGTVVAGDAKVMVNDDALFRHGDLGGPWEELGPLEREAREKGIAFVQLDGNIGVIANGAGLTMATLDNLSLHGGRGGMFLDLGGTDDPRKVEQALEIMIKARPRIILINVFGGMTKCDSVAAGVLAAKERIRPDVPLLVRIRGVNEEKGREMLSAGGIPSFRDLDEACRRAAEIGGD